MIKKVQCINADDIPRELHDFCIDYEFPLHCSSGLVQLDPTNEEAKPFIDWFVSIGGILDDGDITWIGIWGT